MQKYHCFLCVLKGLYICHYAICMTVTLRFRMRNFQGIVFIEIQTHREILKSVLEYL